MSKAAWQIGALESRAGQQLAAKGEMKPFHVLSSHPCSFSLKILAIPKTPVGLPGPRTGWVHAGCWPPVQHAPPFLCYASAWECDLAP